MIQYEGGRDDAKYHGNVQLYCVRQSYLRDVAVSFNIRFFHFRVLIRSRTFRNLNPSKHSHVFFSNPSISNFNQSVIEGPIVSI